MKNRNEKLLGSRKDVELYVIKHMALNLEWVSLSGLDFNDFTFFETQSMFRFINYYMHDPYISEKTTEGCLQELSGWGIYFKEMMESIDGQLTPIDFSKFLLYTQKVKI